MKQLAYGGGSGWFQMRIIHECHGCKAQSDDNSTWLHPHFVRQGDKSWLQTELCPKCARGYLRYWIKVVWKLRIGRFSNFLAPGYGACRKCHTNWHFVEAHRTQIVNGSGCIVLCEHCWPELTAIERVPHYRALYDRWLARGCAPEYDWPTMERAVLAEG